MWRADSEHKCGSLKPALFSNEKQNRFYFMSVI